MRTHSVIYLLNTLFSSPLEVLFTFLIFILCKSLGATPVQLLAMACIKPITSLASFYFSSWLSERSHKIRHYLILNSCIGALPCFTFFFTDNVWFYVVSYGIFMVTRRAVYPAWIEVLKCSYEMPKLTKIVSKGTSIDFATMIILSPLISLWIDYNPHIWKLIFIIAAILKVLGTILITYIKIDKPIFVASSSLNSLLWEPLAKGWKVLREKPQFTHYLALFFLGGAGIIGIHSILPIFFKEELHLSYTELALAFSFCKGISFVTTSPFWAKVLNRTSLYILNCFINVFSCLFLVLVLAANFGTAWLYIAYIFYGTMQAGCKLSKNLSGAVYAGDEDSTFYSSLNLALVGIRGMICPTLGYLLFSISNANTVFVAAFVLCFLGILYGLWLDNRYQYTYQVKEVV